MERNQLSEKLGVATKELETARSMVATNYEKAKKFDDLNCELETVKTTNLDLTSKEKILKEKLEEITNVHKGSHNSYLYSLFPLENPNYSYRQYFKKCV